MRALIEAGANVNRVWDNGFTPLLAAAGNGHLPVVRVLLEAGANKTMQMVAYARQAGHQHVVDELTVSVGRLCTQSPHLHHSRTCQLSSPHTHSGHRLPISPRA